MVRHSFRVPGADYVAALTGIGVVTALCTPFRDALNTTTMALAYLLVDDTYNLYPNFDPQLRAIVMCSIFVLQILGPWLVYRSLALVAERREV